MDKFSTFTCETLCVQAPQHYSNGDVKSIMDWQMNIELDSEVKKTDYTAQRSREDETKTLQRQLSKVHMSSHNGMVSGLFNALLEAE